LYDYSVIVFYKWFIIMWFTIIAPLLIYLVPSSMYDKFILITVILGLLNIYVNRMTDALENTHYLIAIARIIQQREAST